MFSYGSGLASTMFSLHVSKEKEKIEKLLVPLNDVPSRLEARSAVPPAEFTAILKAKEDAYNKGVYLYPISAFYTFVNSKMIHFFCDQLRTSPLTHWIR